MSTDIAAPTTTLSVQVARMIRARLGEEDLSRRQLARMLGVDDTWVGKRLKGHTAITVDDLERFAEALGVEVIDLIPRDRRTPTLTYPSRPPTYPAHARYSGPSGPGRTARIRQTPASAAGVSLASRPTNDTRVTEPPRPVVAVEVRHV